MKQLIVGSGSGEIPPSQCVQTFMIMQDGTDIDIVLGVVNCFSCALDRMITGLDSK